jgi:hypothetical protein
MHNITTSLLAKVRMEQLQAQGTEREEEEDEGDERGEEVRRNHSTMTTRSTIEK